MKKIKLSKEKITKNYTLTDEVLDQFYKSRIVKNLTESSIKYYKEVLGYFIKFRKKEYINEYSKEDITDYIVYMMDKKLSDATINLRLRGVKTLFKFALENEYLDRPVKVNLIKETETIKEVYTVEELEKLLVRPKLDKFHEYRNWVITNFLLCTGARASTLVNVKKRDINFDNDTITFRHTKNRKQQVIPLAKPLKDILMEYLDILDDTVTDDSYLFPNQWGTQLSVIGLQQGIRRYNQSRGVDKTSVHLYRHTFATSYAKSGNLYKLQTLLGHSTLKMSRRYVSISAEDVKDGFDDMCILNKIK